jgi:hypothetical protein
MGVRKIKPSFRSITGFHGASGQEFESSLEKDLLILLQFDTEVDYYESQPLVISYTDSSGVAHTYTPDLLVHYKPGTAKSPLLCEVKYRAEYREKLAELRPKFKAAFRFVKTNGLRFRVMTDREIRTPYLTNAKFLLRYRNIDTDPDHVHMLLDALGRHAEISPELLLSSITEDKKAQASILPALWHLIANSIIYANLNEQLTMATRIKLSSNGVIHHD